MVTLVRPVDAPKLAPCGNPVVSNGTTPVNTVSSLTELHRHRAPSADKASPHRGQTMFQMVEVPVIMEATFSKAKRIAAIDFERTLSADRRYSVGLKKNTHAPNSRPPARSVITSGRISSTAIAASG